MGLMEGQKVERRADWDRRPSATDVLVRRWRQTQFFDLGFSLADARTLADSPADLAQARRVIAAGCPHPLAFRIMR
jgi:hypothetical protein